LNLKKYANSAYKHPQNDKKNLQIVEEIGDAGRTLAIVFFVSDDSILSRTDCSFTFLACLKILIMSPIGLIPI